MIRVLAAPVLGYERPEYDAAVLGHLSPEIRTAIQAKIRQADRQRSITAYALVLEGIERVFALPHSHITIGRSAEGKPKLDGETGIEFNCSHSGGWSICAIGQSPVGIDIEEIGDSPDYSPAGLFHEEERRWIDDLPVEERPAAFYRIWTAKESYLKALGTGFGRPLDSFEIRFLSGGGVIAVDHGEGSRISWIHTNTTQIPGYVVSLCVLSGTTPEKSVEWNIVGRL